MLLTNLARALSPTTAPPARRICFHGLDLETALSFQRYCPLRGCYVIQSQRDPLFCLETPHRLADLVLRGGCA